MYPLRVRVNSTQSDQIKGQIEDQFDHGDLTFFGNA